MMSRRQLVLVVLLVSLCLHVTYAHAQNPQPPSSAPSPSAEKPKQQPADSKPAAAQGANPPQQPAEKPTVANPPPGSETPPEQDQAKSAAAKSHHVITNEDIQAQHDLIASANSDVDIGSINDCDRTCFDMVRGQTAYWLVQNTDWKRELLRGIDQVSEDAKWQAALFHIARMKAKFCDLAQDRNDALANVADPRKMTEDEISIDEQYERKFKAAQAELNSAFAEADAVMRTYSGIVVSFMNLQKQRASNRVCVIRYPMMYRPYNPPRDDPDDP